MYQILHNKYLKKWQIVTIGHIFPLIQAEVNMYFSEIKGKTPEWSKVIKFVSELGLPFIVPDLGYQFQVICFRET